MADNSECNTQSHMIDSNEEIEEWSDMMCIQISLEDKFPAVVQDLPIQKSIINRFLNFYLSGKVQKGLNARDIIFAVIAIIPYSLNSEDVIWEKKHYCDSGQLFYLTPEDKLKTEISNILIQHQKPNDNQQQELTVNESNDTGKNNDIGENNYTSENNDTGKNYDTVENNDTCENNDTGENNNTGENPSDIEASHLNTLNWIRIKPLDNKPQNNKATLYGSVENAAFCISCNKLLEQWDSDITARIYLKYFFGFAALCLMRTIGKSYQHVIQMFLSKFSRIVAFSDDRISYSPPSNACVTKCFKTLRKLERKTQIMFAKLVLNSYFLSNKFNITGLHEKPDTGGITNILRVTVLSHLSNYGMEIISMLQEIATRGDDFNSIFKSLYTDETASSWTKVNNFFKKYMYQSAKQITFHWARVIDKKQFEYLSCQNNFELAVVIAVFVENLTSNEGIWEARWVKSGNNLETYKKLGLKLFKEYKLHYTKNLLL